MSNSNKPVAKPIFRKQLAGGISSAVFESTRDGRTYRSVNIQRSYLKDGKWKRMSLYLDHEHIPFMIDVLESTWKFLNDYPIGSMHSESEQDQPEAQVEDSDQPTEVAA